MNKIVREHYPVEKLPEDLRVHFSQDALVTIQLQQEEANVQFAPPTTPMSTRDVAALIRGLHENRPDKGRSMDDIVAEVRALRDEWDD